MAAAVACRATFVRVNVFVSATWTDQGLIQGCADTLMRYRRVVESRATEALSVAVPGWRTPLIAGPLGVI